jgi:hypothetical protein
LKFALVILAFLLAVPLSGISQQRRTGDWMPRQVNKPSATASTNSQIFAPFFVTKITDLTAVGTYTQNFVSTPEFGDFVVVTGDIGTMRSVMTLSKEVPATFGVHSESNLTYAITISKQTVVTSVNGQNQTVQLGNLSNLVPLHSNFASSVSTTSPQSGDFTFVVGAQIPGEANTVVTTGQLSGVFNVTVCSN